MHEKSKPKQLNQSRDLGDVIEFFKRFNFETRVLRILSKIRDQGVYIMAKFDEINAKIDAIGTGLEEIDGDVKEIQALVASHVDGMTAAEVAIVSTKLDALVARTTEVAALVPEPPTA